MRQEKIVVIHTYCTAGTKTMVHERPHEASASMSESFLPVEGRLTKALAGLCSLNELSTLIFDGIITDADYDQILAEHKFVEE